MTLRILVLGTNVLILVRKPCTSMLMCMAFSLSQSACVTGIPPPDGWAPPKVKPCHIVVMEGDNRACLTRWEFAEWRRVNGL